MAMAVQRHAHNHCIHIHGTDPSLLKATANVFDEPWTPVPIEALSNAESERLASKQDIVISYGDNRVPNGRNNLVD